MADTLSTDPVALAEFFGLLVECPLHGGNPEHCPLQGVRELPMADRFEWAKGLEIVEAHQISIKCAQCMGRQRRVW